MRKFRSLIAALLFAAPSIAFAASTVNPTVPATNAPMASAPIRGNFQATYNDINNILGKFNATSAPFSPSTYQEWVDTTTATAPNFKVYVGGNWVSIGTFNCTGSPCTWSLPSSVYPASVPISTNLNAASLQAAQTGALFQGQAANSTVARAELDSFGAISSFTGVVAGGTKASPTAVTSGTQLTGINAYAYNGASFVGPIVSFRTYAAENIASGHQGSQACIATTPTSSTTLGDGLCQNATTGITLGSPTGGDKGAGTLNSAGSIYINNVLVDGISTANSLTNKAIDSSNIGAVTPGTGKFTTLQATGAITTAVTGSTQCLQVNSSGVVAGSGAGCGGSAATLMTQQVLTSGSGATYTTPANVRQLQITIVGAGGGGGGNATDGTGSAGGTGGFSSFDNAGTNYKASGGTGGEKGQTANAPDGGNGGTGGTGGTSPNTYSIPGGVGGNGIFGGSAGSYGGNGGSSCLGGGVNHNTAAIANSGAGGNGAAAGASATPYAGAGGGGGECKKVIINSPSGTYTYTIGAAGTAGTAGTGGNAGTAGATGRIIVDEIY